jgi:hypothetical protein
MKPLSLRLVTLAASLLLIVAACNPAASTPSPVPPSQGPIPPASAAPSAMESSVPSEAPSVAGLGGHWTGSWTDTSPDTSSGGFDLTWTQDGSSLSGNITITGAACISTATVTGTLNGNTITFGAVSGQVQITYTGSVGADMNSMQGTYSAPNCGDAQGNWSASRA